MIAGRALAPVLTRSPSATQAGLQHVPTQTGATESVSALGRIAGSRPRRYVERSGAVE